jgi:hypothetical protein
MLDVIIYIGICTYINRMLRHRHPEVWQAQGCPTFWNNSPANGIRFFKYFIIGSDFKNLHDRQLDLYVMIMRVLFMLAMTWLFGTVIFDVGSRTLR